MEWAGYFGFMAFVIVLCGLPDSGKVKRLQKRVRMLERKQNGGESMSKIIGDLVNAECKMKVSLEGELAKVLNCTVLDADEEWVKIRYQNKKQEDVVKIIRIENVLEVDL